MQTIIDVALSTLATLAIVTGTCVLLHVARWGRDVQR